MTEHFEPGEVLFRQGDSSAFAVLVHAGSAEVLRDAGDQVVVIGTIHAGEFVGEMGVLDGQPRSATVRAAEPVEAELIEGEAFLDRVSNEPELARQLLVRMSTRLRDIDEALVQLHLEGRNQETPQPHARPEADPFCTLAAGNSETRHLIGSNPIPVVRTPYIVGRADLKGERFAKTVADLPLRDHPPFRLSHAHFSLTRRGETVLVQDLASEFGTIVNDRPIGRAFAVFSVELEPGTSRIVAGGRNSPFIFEVTR